MTTSNDMLIYCETNNIDVTFKNLPENGSISFKFNNNCYIGIDDKKMTEAERKSHIAHEIGHCETNSFYNPYTPLDERTKHEYQANRWALKKLIPKKEFLCALKHGMTEVWELAEHFEVPEDTVRFAYTEYLCDSRAG